MSSDDLEIRVTELEIKLSFQTATIDALNTVIADQVKRLDALQEKLKLLHDQLRALSLNEAPSEKPPHY